MRKANRLYASLLLFFILVIIIQQGYLFLKLKEVSKKDAISANALGEVKFCMNHPPFLNSSCNFTTLQDSLFSCLSNATDADSQALNFYSAFISPPALFNVTLTGLISFTPNASFVGNHSFYLSVDDSSGCENSEDIDLFTFNVINVNDAPVLIAPIPNQSWQYGSSITPFDLDNYFFDADNDILTYTTAPSTVPNINIVISPNNMVTFTATNDWSGTTTVIFYAWDPYFANGSSNSVSLTVAKKQTSTNPSGGSSSGGGGGGSPPVCPPKWYCRPWGVCEPDGFKRRECYDLNNCSTSFGKPNITEACKFLSTCFDGFKGADEEEIDCGGICPACESCSDKICNNKEDCVNGLTGTPDCGGPCKPCGIEKKESCFDSACNNGEDCIYGKSEMPDCGGNCVPCIITEMPRKFKEINWVLVFLILLTGIVSMYTARKISLYLAEIARRKKRPMLDIEATKALYESIIELEKLLASGADIEKVIIMFSEIVRKYFRSLLKLKYECTYEEIMLELGKLGLSDSFKKVLLWFFERSTEIEFSGRGVSRQEMAAMIEEFKQIVSLTSTLEFSEEEKEKKKIPANKADRIYFMISSAEANLRNKKLNEAYEKYLTIHKEFKLLEKKDKEQLYRFIARLYEEINLAREFYTEEKGK